MCVSFYFGVASIVTFSMYRCMPVVCFSCVSLMFSQCTSIPWCVQGSLRCTLLPAWVVALHALAVHAGSAVQCSEPCTHRGILVHRENIGRAGKISGGRENIALDFPTALLADWLKWQSRTVPWDNCTYPTPAPYRDSLILSTVSAHQRNSEPGKGQ